MTSTRIPFSLPSLTEAERRNVTRALERRDIGAYGPFMTSCERLLQARFGGAAVLLTQSASSALELAAMLAGLGPGDEVVMPSLTYITTASTIAARGAVPVFVDIRADTCNLDEAAIEAAITPRTRAILPVHYGGVACAMDEIAVIAARHRLDVIEDAAQAFGASYKSRPLGTFGRLAACSFHYQKNVAAGQAGALLLNRADDVARAEILRDAGTDRARFARGEVAKYQWQDISASTAPSELVAAVLAAQLDRADDMQARRQAIWQRYRAGFVDAARRGVMRIAEVPAECSHNAHLFYFVFADTPRRDAFIAHMAEAGIDCRTHFEPLHLSPGGRRWARAAGPLPVTEATAAGLVRLPIWPDMVDEPARVIEAARAFLRAM